MHKKLFLLGLFGLLFSQGFTVQNEDVVKIRAYALKSEDTFSAESSTQSAYAWGGHAWISIENTTADSIQRIAGYSLAPRHGMTISVWMNKEPHVGAWVNIEQLYPSDKHIATRELTLNEYQVGRISTYINDHNKWDLWNNAANFTSNIWNLFADKNDQIKAGWMGSPDALYKSIRETRNSIVGRVYPINPEMGYIENGRFKYKTPEVALSLS